MTDPRLGAIRHSIRKGLGAGDLGGDTTEVGRDTTEVGGDTTGLMVRYGRYAEVGEIRRRSGEIRRGWGEIQRGCAEQRRNVLSTDQ